MTGNHSKELIRCELENLNLQFKLVDSGEVEFIERPTIKQNEEIKKVLQRRSFEIIENRKEILTERIKNVVKEMVYLPNQFPRTNYSYHISQSLQLDYTYLSNIFSEVEKITIEHYIIFHKIEKAKQHLKCCSLL